MNGSKIMNGHRRNGMGRAVIATAALLVAGGAYAHGWDAPARAGHGAAGHELEHADQQVAAAVMQEARPVAAAVDAAGGSARSGIAVKGEDIVGGQSILFSPFFLCALLRMVYPGLIGDIIRLPCLL